MIKEIHIKNFQSHEETHLELSKGVNVIIGRSNSGKSSIIRALRWLVDNRPVGDSFRSHWIEKKETASVTVTFDDTKIIREKGAKSHNQYQIQDQIYTALRQDVPNEVKNAHQLEFYNLQGQFDSFFLLQDSPNEIAKKLHSLCGLSIIDESFKRLNSDLLHTNKEIKILKEQADHMEKDLEKYATLDVIEVIVKEIESLEGERNDIQEKIKDLQKKAYEANKLTGEIEELVEWLTIEQKAEKLHRLLEESKTNRSIQGRLIRTIKEYKKIMDEINDIQGFIDQESVTSTLIKETKEICDIVKQVQDIIDICKEAQEIMNIIKTIEENKQHCQKKHDSIIEGLEICPMCNQKLNKTSET